jgi:DNA-binding CsgD family transcriptional regulator
MNLQRKRVHGEDSRFFLDDLKTRELEIHSRLVRISGMGSNLFSELRPAVPGVISGEMETTCQRPLPSQRSFAPIPELTSFGLPSNGTNGQVAQKPCRSRVLNGKRNGGALRPLDLTPRETEVLIWVAQGKTNYEIGVILSAATRTICKHVQRILFKLNVENRTAAAAIALATLANAKR